VNDASERSQFESRLPDDRGYWEDLAERIVQSAEPVLRERREAESWWQPLAKWGPAIGVAAAVAALLVAVAGPPQAARPQPVSLARLLAPEDPIEQAVVSGAAVTDISVMLLVESGGQR
jgi:hypothetical protein